MDGAPGDGEHCGGLRGAPEARGADVEDIKFVINYDYPNSSEDYVHRIGRTARSTNKGTAYTFFTPGNLKQARELVKVLQEANQTINPKLMQLVDHGRGGGGGGGRSRYRTISTNNNPNMMYQEECDRRMRGKDGGRRDGRNNRDGIASNGTGRDHGRQGYGYLGQNSNFQPSQYGYGQGAFTAGAAGSYGAATYGQAPQPLMSQQFVPPVTPLLNYMNTAASSYQYAPPPPPPPPPARK